MNDYYLYEYEERFKYLTSICLNLTDACNLRCRYCFVHQQPNYMTYETAKDAVDWVANNLKIKKENNWANTSDKFHITFFGGEPMLMFEKIIVPLVNYIEEVYPNEYDLGITTNGTLLDENKIKWLYDHNISPLLSMDGNKYTQDLNRPCADETQSSFDLVQKNIPILLKYFPNTTFRSTIDENTVDHTFENYVFAEQSGFKSIFMIPNGRSSWKQENLFILKEELNKIFQYRIHQYLLYKMPIAASFIDKSYDRVKQNMQIFTQHMDEFDRDKIHRVIRCGLGTGSGSIGFNGNIYGCQEQDSYAGENSIFYLGNIYKDGIERELHDQLLNTYAYQGACKCENQELCYNCNFKNLCYELNCPSSSQDCFAKFDISSESHCIWFNLLYENCLTSSNFLLAQNNKLFKNYFINI